MIRNHLTIWRYDFSYRDDAMYNDDYPFCDGFFIGNKNDWKEFVQWQQHSYGTNFKNVKKRRASKSEVEYYIDSDDDLGF